jgi:hypothetical protein
MAKQKRPKLNPLVIEKQTTLGEVQTKSMELVRLSRVKYEGNDYQFIDVRIFQRGYDEHGCEVYHPTKRGVQLKESDFQKLITPFWTEPPDWTDRPVH